jgi:hypothetical protein
VPHRADDEIIASLLPAGFEFDPAELVDDRDAVLARYAEYVGRDNDRLAALGAQGLVASMNVYASNARLMETFEPAVFGGDLVLFTATGPSRGAASGSGADPRPARRPGLTPDAWRPYVAGRIHIHDVDVLHNDMLSDPAAVAAIGRVLDDVLEP